MIRFLARLTDRAAAKHPVNTAAPSRLSWPYAAWWQHLAAPLTGSCCPDCGIAAASLHRDGCITGSWDGGTWA